MACPTFYVTDAIKRKRKPGGMESSRGRQIHHTVALYSEHCALRQCEMDPETFDKFSAGAGAEAARILSGIRDTYRVDFAHFLAAELTMRLDANLQPTQVDRRIEAFCKGGTGRAHYEGTLDVVYLFRNENRIVVPDFKSHPKPFDPDDLSSKSTKIQARKYSLMVFQHFPWVMEVEFVLIFVRYRNTRRSIIFTRNDVPKLVDAVRSARARQFAIHEAYDRGEFDGPQSFDLVVPGWHCVYCPLLSDRSCPLGEMNEYSQASLEDRLKWAIWNREFSKVNMRVLSDHVQATGRAVVIRDYNGLAYKYGPVSKPATALPLFVRDSTGKGIIWEPGGARPYMPIVNILENHAETDPDDIGWFPKITISSKEIGSKRGASKRAILDQALAAAEDHFEKQKMEISKPLETVVEEEEEVEDEEE